MSRRTRSASISRKTISRSIRCSIGRWRRRRKTFRRRRSPKIDQFMRGGGTILFDTRDSPIGGLGGTASPGEAVLRRLLSKLDIPPLEPCPPDHVLTRDLLSAQGISRAAGAAVRSGSRPCRPSIRKIRRTQPVAARGGDGVSPIIMGGNDWAAAWARDEMRQSDRGSGARAASSSAKWRFASGSIS